MRKIHMEKMETNMQYLASFDARRVLLSVKEAGHMVTAQMLWNKIIREARVPVSGERL